MTNLILTLSFQLLTNWTDNGSAFATNGTESGVVVSNTIGTYNMTNVLTLESKPIGTVTREYQYRKVYSPVLFVPLGTSTRTAPQPKP